MIVSLSFDKNWIVSDGGLYSLSVKKFIRSCKNDFGDQFKVRDDSMFGCTAEFSVSCPASELETKLSKIIAENVTGGQNRGGLYSLSITGQPTAAAPEEVKKSPAFDSDLTAQLNAALSRASEKPERAHTSTAAEPPAIPASEAPKAASAAETPKNASAEAPKTAPAPAHEMPAAAPAEGGEAMADIEALIGAEDFKKLCRDVHACAPVVIENHTQHAFLAESYLFAINLGDGYSRALELLAALLTEDGIFEKKGQVLELTLPDPSDQNRQDNIKHMLDNVSSAFSPSHIVSFDVSNWISHTGAPEFKDFLLSVFRKSSDCIIVFRSPVLPSDKMKQTVSDISDVIEARPVVFEPFTPQQLRTAADGILSGYGFSADDDAWEIFGERMVEERRDGFFYGLHTVQKISNEMIRCSQLYSAKNGLTGKTITAQAVEELRPEKISDGLGGMEALDSLVGMEQIKAQLSEIVNQIVLSRTGGMRTQPCMHMRFLGSPGTGKTTVARIIGRILSENGILRIGKFYEHKGRDLCGRYVGETTPKTTAICQEAYGSVLFIDEAYSLFRSDASGADYGREAIDALIAEMENHSDDLLVIFAGYPEDMDTLMHANQGMASRIPYTIKFPNYTREQLLDIFMRMSSEYFHSGDDYADAAREYFLGLPDSILESPEFGNARYVRNLYERVWSKAALRCPVKDISQLVLTAEDFHAGAAAISDGMTEKPHIKLGFN